MARLYSNENFPLPVVEELRQLGHDVLTIRVYVFSSPFLVSDENKKQAKPSNQCPTRRYPDQRSGHFIRLHRAQPEHARSNRRLATTP